MMFSLTEPSSGTIFKKVKSADALQLIADTGGCSLNTICGEDTEGYVYVAYTPRIKRKPYKEEEYTLFEGEIINVNNLFTAIGKIREVDNYGANSTVNYLAIRFPSLSVENQGFPVVSVRPNDFLLIDITLPNLEWLNEHNLFNFTPYFFTLTDEDGISTNVFASIDNTVSFFKDVQPGSIKKICCTSNNSIAESYTAQGYHICRIPIEYMANATFLPIFRVGIMHEKMGNLPFGMVKVAYYQSVTVDRTADTTYADTRQIIQTFDRPLEPLSDSSTRAIHNAYNDAIQDISTAGYQVFLTFNYLSRLAKVKFAFQSFYDAVSIRPVIEMLGNNTGENYFISDDIDITQYNVTDTLYILSVNQALTQCAVASNVQVYNRSNNALVPNGTFLTSPDLPPMSVPTYPFSSSREVHAYPTMMISQYSLKGLLQAGVRKIAIAERNAYNPINFAYTSNMYVDTACYFIGEDLDEALRNVLETRRGCRLRKSNEAVRLDAQDVEDDIRSSSGTNTPPAAEDQDQERASYEGVHTD